MVGVRKNRPWSFRLHWAVGRCQREKYADFCLFAVHHMGEVTDHRDRYAAPPLTETMTFSVCLPSGLK